MKWKENHNQPDRWGCPQLSNQTQQRVNWIAHVQSHRHLFCLLDMLLSNAECECKNENYAHVLGILTAASLDWSDWFSLWENLPMCPGFRVVKCETWLFPWLLKGEQTVEPGILISKCFLHWLSEVLSYSLCLIVISWNSTFFVILSAERGFGWDKILSRASRNVNLNQIWIYLLCLMCFDYPFLI